jgi:hypothetical protein
VLKCAALKQASKQITVPHLLSSASSVQYRVYTDVDFLVGAETLQVDAGNSGAAYTIKIAPPVRRPCHAVAPQRLPIS